ncbi:hypothetical protein AB0P07_32205 [Streptomyces sp. NPDC085944]|uniref:hypothetical protein n=1 Tax=Streptomyces sp. NPDC085944 TaxID=3154962 RepID=UPI0034253518
MTHLIAMSLPYGIDPVYLVAALGLLALALAGWSFRRNRNRAEGRRVGTPAVWVSALAALNCTIYSADTSWRFAADYLDMAGTVERAMMFSAGEAALFATALMARQNLKSQGAPGLPGALVWVITGVQVIPAYAESAAVGGTVRAFVGPVMAAVLWHLAMGIELRLHKPDAASQGLLATLGREARERLLSRLGIATRNRDAAQITKDRASRRAVALASQLAGMSMADREKDTRVTRRLQAALTRAEVGTDPRQRQAFLEELAARRHAATLATIDLPSPWVKAPDPKDAGLENGYPLAPSPSMLSAAEKPMGRRASAVPNDGPRSGGDGDRAESGTGTEAEGDRPHTVPDDNGDGVTESVSSLPSGGTGTALGDRGDVSAMGAAADVAIEVSATDAREAAAQGAMGPSPVPVPDGGGDGEHLDAEMGTGTVGDRPHTVPNDNGDRAHPDTETGTGTEGDRPHTVPVRRKPKPKAKAQRSRPGGGKSQRPQRKGLSPEETADLVRPHVPALLERDGTEVITRPQLREILRALNLAGGRNSNITRLLQLLRSETNTTTARSTTR